jgi:hypothetical protein
MSSRSPSRAAPAELSRDRGAPTLVAARSVRDPFEPTNVRVTPTRSARTPRVARSGLTRGRVWCSAATAARRPGASPERAGTVRLRRSRRAGPSQGPRGPATRFRGVSEGRGPLHPGLREEVRDRLHPRCLPSMGRLDSGTRAFVRFRLSGGALSTGCHQPVEKARCRAIAGGPCSDPAALTGSRRHGLGLRCGRDGPRPAR